MCDREKSQMEKRGRHKFGASEKNNGRGGEFFAAEAKSKIECALFAKCAPLEKYEDKL